MGTIDILSNNTEKRLTMQQTKEESPSVLLFTQLHPTLCDPVSSSHEAPVCGSLQTEYWSEWAAMPSSRGSPQPRDRTQVCHIAGGFFYLLSHQGSPKEATDIHTVHNSWSQEKFFMFGFQINRLWFLSFNIHIIYFCVGKYFCIYMFLILLIGFSY